MHMNMRKSELEELKVEVKWLPGIHGMLSGCAELPSFLRSFFAASLKVGDSCPLSSSSPLVLVWSIIYHLYCYLDT